MIVIPSLKVVVLSNVFYLVLTHKLCLKVRKKLSFDYLKVMILTYYCVIVGNMGWDDWRYSNTNCNSTVGHVPNRLAKRGTVYMQLIKLCVIWYILLVLDEIFYMLH